MYKKLLILLTVFLLLIVQSAAYADTDEVVVEIPDFDVRVNGELIDTEHSQYPVISYKNITYLPMTADYLSGLGLGLKFSSIEGLEINKKDEVGVFEQKFLGANNIFKSKHTARLAPFAIKVNGNTIVNSKEEYPIITYKDITYFPMTWRFAVEEFGWKTKWSNEEGFKIIIEKRASEEINFPDKNLELLVRKKINKPTGSIHKSDVEKISELETECDSSPTTDSLRINSLEGIQYLTNLEKLDLKWNNISDLTPISNLVNLKDIGLSCNNITDVAPISNLVNLTNLSLGCNNIVDIDSISNLKNLQDLYLCDTNLKDISFLKNMKSLKFVFLHVNEISDISVLNELPNLKYVHISDNPINKTSFNTYYPILTKKGVSINNIYSEYSELTTDNIEDVFHIDEIFKCLSIKEYLDVFDGEGNYYEDYDSVVLDEGEFYERGSISIHEEHGDEKIIALFNLGKIDYEKYTNYKDILKEKYGEPLTEDLKESIYDESVATIWKGIELSYATYGSSIMVKIETDSDENEYSTYEIEAFLLENYGELETNIGTTNFTFNISKNKSISSPYDYWIQVEYEYEYFEGAMNNIEYTNKQKNKLKQELKSHQKSIADGLIELLPDKKLYGGYYNSWYTYPALKVDLNTRYYFSWTNYDVPSNYADSKYEDTKPSKFRWYDDIDDSL